MTANHLTVRSNHVPTKEKGCTDQSAPQGQPITKRHFTAPATLLGWIDAGLLAQLALLAAAVFLIVGGLNYA